MAKNFIDKKGKGKMENVPVSRQAAGNLTKLGRNYKNDSLDTDFTSISPVKRKK